MNEVKNDLRERTTEFALRIVKLYISLPKTTQAQVLGKQVLQLLRLKSLHHFAKKLMN